MFGEEDSWVRNMSQPSQSQSQSCLMSLEHLVRLLGDCGPPVYLYFISVPPGGWEPHLVTRQIRNINLAEVVISHNQDSHSPSQVCLSPSLFSLQLVENVITFVQERTPAIPARRQYRVKGCYKIVENISSQIIYI